VVDLLGASEPVPVTVELSWRASSPLAVELLFLATHRDSHDVSWLVARDLLAEGLYLPVGIGDVHVRPHQSDWETTVLVLDSHAGRAEFELDTDALSDFLQATYDHIPPGAEHMALDLDTHIALLLEGENR
jgi:hypothetical protein